MLQMLTTMRKAIPSNRAILYQLSSVEDFLKSIAPIRILSCMSGTSFLRITNKKATTPSYIIVCSLLVVVTASLIRIILEAQKSTKSFTSITARIQNITLPLSCILSIITVAKNSKRIAHIVNELLNLSKYIQVKQWKNLYWTEIYLIVGVTCVNEITQGYFIYENLQKYGAKRTVPLYIIESYLELISWLMRLEFAGFLYIFALIIQIINKKFASISGHTQYLPLSTVDEKIALDLSPYIEIYEKVLSLAEDLNKSFGMTLGMAALAFTVNNIIIVYYHILYTPTYGITLSGAFSSLHSITELFQLWLPLMVCELFAAEVTRTAKLCHKVMRQTALNHAHEQLESFSIYLIHRKVKFTICGMVDLNYSLLFSIAGGITSYMIVLIQFQILETPDLRKILMAESM